MRKSILVSGVIAAGMIFLGTVLKIFHLPASSPLLILGVALMMLWFLPVLLIYRIKNDTTVFQKITSVFGFIVGWLFLFPGLLFAVQKWPGGVFLVMLGIAGGLIFLLLFFLSNGKAGTPVSPKSPFNIIISVIVITLFIGRYFVHEAFVAKIKQEILDYGQVISEKNNLQIWHDKVVTKLYMNSPDSVRIMTVQDIDLKTFALLTDIDNAKRNLISFEEGSDPRFADSISYLDYKRPGGWDESTHLFVGNDPENPNGKGVEIFDELKKYQQEVLSPGIKLDIDLSDPILVDDYPTNWVRATFYHSDMIHTLTTLTKFEIAILKAEKELLEQQKIISAE